MAGVEYCVTVLQDGYEYQGRPFKSLSALAKSGFMWLGWMAFGIATMRPNVMSLGR